MEFKVTFLLLSTLYGITLCQDTDDFSRLYKKITTGYNVNVRPILDIGQPTQVNASFLLLSIKEYEEKASKLSIVGIFTLTWKDAKMAWNPYVHEGIHSLLIPQNQVWIPEIINGKPYDKIEPLGFERLNVRVIFDGTIEWMPGDVYQTTCSADVTYYPFDVHRCEFIFSPWMYSADELFLQAVCDEMDLDAFTPSGLWELKSTQVYVDHVLEAQLFVLKLEFKRRPMFHIVNILVPITVLGILNVLVFLLPADSGERVGFSITVLLAMSVFLTIIADSLPSTSQPSIPRMSYLLLADLVIGTMITICTILVLRLHHKGEDETVPRWLRCLSCRGCCSKRMRGRQSILGEPDTFSEMYTDEIYLRPTNVWSNTENINPYSDRFNKFGRIHGRAVPRKEIRNNRYQQEEIPSHYNSRPYLQEDYINKQEPFQALADYQYIVKWKDIADFFDFFFFVVFLLAIIAKIVFSVVVFLGSV
ncbi:acetylcholine receptor subunit beta-like [Ylistrum balloti]|uniref:acetylcholine receptor subunit beta-like n=1 Tax=Ylistrum balloti TaxID=509963 RepID=UPI002905C160|nr:acetylcholine receptor subunit beta-like [Ylistrum balloti]